MRRVLQTQGDSPARSGLVVSLALPPVMGFHATSHAPVRPARSTLIHASTSERRIVAARPAIPPDRRSPRLSPIGGPAAAEPIHLTAQGLVRPDRLATAARSRA